MTKDLVTRMRNVFEDTPQIMTWFDEETYVGAEVRSHISGMWETLKEAADRIEHLERELGEERHSREIAAAKGWEFSDRIKELENKLQLAIEMRLTQKLYFKERTPDLLINSKMSEAAFDRAMVENKND
jgi:predicted nuclease with TOPRIM domain